MINWKARVQEVYSSLSELREYQRIYRVVTRCGYDSARKLWDDNPMIGGSVNPTDFGLVKVTRHVKLTKGNQWRTKSKSRS